ncbi:unnamed protein product, partial [Leptidea sinapis]
MSKNKEQIISKRNQAAQEAAFKKTDDCIIALVQHKPASCTLAIMVLRSGKIQKINDNSWIVIPTTEELVRKMCDGRTHYEKIKGPQIITISEGCVIQIMNRTLQAHRFFLNMNEIIPLPHQQDYSHKSPADFTLHIEDISLDNILINQAREVEDPDEVNLPLIMATPSWTTVTLYFIGFVIISKKIYQWLKNKRMKPNPSASEEASEDAGGSCKLRFHLEGGGVTGAPS